MKGIAAKLVILLMTLGCSGAELFKSEQLVGLWRVNPSTAAYYFSMTPNSFPPSLPKGTEKFGLTLNNGGSCVLSNAPSKFLWDHSPAITNCEGSWVLSSKPTPGASYSFGDAYSNRNSTNEFARLTVTLKPLPNEEVIFEFPVIWQEKGPASAKRPAIIVGPRKGTNGYQWWVMITKQD